MRQPKRLAIGDGLCRVARVENPYMHTAAMNDPAVPKAVTPLKNSFIDLVRFGHSVNWLHPRVR